MKVIIGTKNQKKVDVTISVFKTVLNIADIETIAINADSKVSEAPHNEETFQGAQNRAQQCFQQGNADYYIGLESGLAERYGNMYEEAWAVILTSSTKKYIGYSSGLMLPDMVVKRMQNGEKHNEIMVSIDEMLNLPVDNRDTWSRYTGGSISRRLSMEEAIRNALVQALPSTHNLYTL